MNRYIVSVLFFMTAVCAYRLAVHALDDANPDAREVAIFKGKREISVTRETVKNDFIKAFMKLYGK